MYFVKLSEVQPFARGRGGSVSQFVIVCRTAVWIDGTSQRFTCTNKHARQVRL